MHPIIANNPAAIRALAREVGVPRLEVFGSVSTEKFAPETSDIDFLVEYPQDDDFGPWLSRHFAVEAALANLLARKVGFVMVGATRHRWFRREANKTRAVLHDGSEIAEVA